MNIWIRRFNFGRGRLGPAKGGAGADEYYSQYHCCQKFHSITPQPDLSPEGRGETDREVVRSRDCGAEARAGLKKYNNIDNSLKEDKQAQEKVFG